MVHNLLQTCKRNHGRKEVLADICMSSHREVMRTFCDVAGWRNNLRKVERARDPLMHHMSCNGLQVACLRWVRDSAGIQGLRVLGGLAQRVSSGGSVSSTSSPCSRERVELSLFPHCKRRIL